MDFHAVVVVGIEMPREQIAQLNPLLYAGWLGVYPEFVREAWIDGDDGRLIRAKPQSLRVFYVDDMVDLCFGGKTTALALPLADFNFEFRTKDWYTNRERLAFSLAELQEAFNTFSEHLGAAGINHTTHEVNVKLFTPVTISGT